MYRGQGKDRMRQDLNSVQAYQSIFKHIRSVSQASWCSSTLLFIDSHARLTSLKLNTHDTHIHIHAIQAIYFTAMDPFDQEMGPTREFRQHFRKLLTETRHGDVSYHEVDILLDLITRSAETLREQRKLSKDTSEEHIYRKLFESLGPMGGSGSNGAKAAAAAAAVAAGGGAGADGKAISGGSGGSGSPGPDAPPKPPSSSSL